MRRVLLLALVAAAPAAGAYEYLDFKVINTQADPLGYYVDSRSSAPAGVALSAVQVAAETAWNTWNGVPCASPSAVFRGLTASVVPDPPNRYDVYSVTPVWLSNPQDPDFDDILGPAPNFVLSVAIPVSVGGVLKTCDVYLNGTASWSAGSTASPGYFDVQTVLLHETGHCLGLGHNGFYQRDVMYQSLGEGDFFRALGPDDVDSLCARYPLPGGETARCKSDGTCNGPDLKCLPQPQTNGLSISLCSRGCAVGTNAGCPLPTSCQTSAAFAPAFDGACLLPGSQVTPVGAPCDGQSDCGPPNAQCFAPESQPSGTLFWEGGYCTQDCAPGQPPCPAGAECVDFGGGYARCLQSCRVGLSDCRPGYACADLSTGNAVCLPACGANSDCADPTHFDCRLCDGLCVPKQNPSGQVGDACQSNDSCGPGQTCEPSLGWQCSRQCSRGCAVCPTGSSCNATSRGLFCLRDCTGPGTCPSGLRCADTETGKGCLPACSTNNDCPVGQSCYAGECYSPVEDAGCGTLCNRPDAGRPIVPSRDAGVGGGDGSGGCGCQPVGASPAWLALGWLALGWFGRRAWRRP